MSTRRSLQAFTLIELLVAIFVSAVVFALGYGAITQALENRVAIESQQARVNALQKTVRLMTQDFVQLAPRPVRQPVGDGWQPAFEAQADKVGPLVAFTRNGWANPAGIQRPGLQRVAYVFEDGKLVREHWPVLDATLASEPVRRELLAELDTVSFRFMDGGHQWNTEWPIIQPGNQEYTLRMRPIAVEVTLELEDWGRIVRLIEVGG
jgi:general secretion pathway protein J